MKEKIIKKYLPYTIVILLGFLYMYLACSAFYIGANGDLHTTYAAYGDTQYHLTQISKFAYGNIDFADPIFLGESLRYPFVVNFISGILLKITGLMRFSIVFPLVISALGIILLIFSIYKKIFSSRLIASACLFLFIFSSGYGIYYSLRHYEENKIAGKTSLESSFISYYVNDNGNSSAMLSNEYPEQNIDFGSPLKIFLVHQRAFYLGMLSFLALTYFLMRLSKENAMKWKIYAGIIYGVMPFMHMHSFIAGSVLISVFLLFYTYKKDYRFIMPLAIGVILALPQVYYLADISSNLIHGSGFSKIRFGWMVESGYGSVNFPENVQRSVFSSQYLNFLWFNFGTILPAFIISSVYALWKRKNEFITIFAIFGIGIFLLVNIVQFQPWDFDNNKLLIFYELAAIAVIAFSVKEIYDKKKIVGILVGLIIFSTGIIGGVIDVLPMVINYGEKSPVMFDTNAILLAEWVRKNIPIDEQILTGTDHSNPVVSLAGRQIIEGYEGWLWSRNIDYSPRSLEIKSFYGNPEVDSDLLKKYDIKYILLDSLAVNDYKAKEETFDKLFKREVKFGDFIMYSVRG